MDVYAHCAELVRTEDKERFLADLFAPEALRRHLFALHAFNCEVAGIREKAREPLPGEMRLQWWRDVLAAGEGGGHPVAAALIETIRAFDLPGAAFDDLLAARIFDLYDDPMPSLAAFEGYAGETNSRLFQMAAMILGDGGAAGVADAAGHGGVADALARHMYALPLHARRRQLFLPADRLSAQGVDPDTIFAGRTTPGLVAALGDLRTVARRHLDLARAAARGLPPDILPVFLPLALVEPLLGRLEAAGADPLTSVAEIPQWRRQWTLWRAARRAGGGKSFF